MWCGGRNRLLLAFDSEWTQSASGNSTGSVPAWVPCYHPSWQEQQLTFPDYPHSAGSWGWCFKDSHVSPRQVMTLFCRTSCRVATTHWDFAELHRKKLTWSIILKYTDLKISACVELNQPPAIQSGSAFRFTLIKRFWYFKCCLWKLRWGVRNNCRHI